MFAINQAKNSPTNDDRITTNANSFRHK
jgi:hypothetical protein